MQARSDEPELVREVQITPVKPIQGIVGFASLIFADSFYMGSIAIVTRPSGGYRLLYPTKKIGNSSLNIFHPVNRNVGDHIEEAVLAKYEEVMTKAIADAVRVIS